MALFKILAGKEKLSADKSRSIMTFDESKNEQNLSGIEWHEGWAYVTADKGNLFIDVLNDNYKKRIKIGELSDRSLQAAGDSEGNIIVDTYIQDIELQDSHDAPYYLVSKPNATKSFNLPLPIASESYAGVITADTENVQVLAGPKTFTGQIIIKGAEGDKPLIVRNVVGSNQETGAGPLYLQYGNTITDTIYLGENGGATITDDGKEYSGNAATTTRALNDIDGNPILDWYIHDITLKNDGAAPQYRLHDGTGNARETFLDIPVADAEKGHAGVVTTGRQIFTGEKFLDENGSLTVQGANSFIYDGLRALETSGTYNIWFSDTTNNIPQYSVGLKYNPASKDAWTGCPTPTSSFSLLTVDKIEGLAHRATEDDDGHVLRTHYLYNIELTNSTTAPYYTLYQGDTKARKDSSGSNFKLLVPVASTQQAGVITSDSALQTFTGSKKLDSAGYLKIDGRFAYSGIDEADTTSTKERPLWFESNAKDPENTSQNALGIPEYSANLTYNSKTKTLTTENFKGLATHATADSEGRVIEDTYLQMVNFNHTDSNKDTPYYTFTLGSGNLQKVKVNNQDVNYTIYLPVASETRAGIVTCVTDQTFGGKKTFAGSIVILGNAADKSFMTRGIVGSDGNGNEGGLYLQYGNTATDRDIYLGAAGAHKIHSDGAEYTGNSATTTCALNDMDSNPILDWYLHDITLNETAINAPVYKLHDGTGKAREGTLEIPVANGTTKSGIVTTGDQSFGGVKTFAGFNYSGITNKSTDANTHYLWIGKNGAIGTPVYSSKLSYVPSTDTLTCANFAGNATSATKAVKDGNDVEISTHYLASLSISDTYQISYNEGNGKSKGKIALPFAAASTCGGAALSANKWASAITITLGGDLSGSVSFDGSAGKTLSATIKSASVTNITDGLYVRITGDTMTGPLAIANSTASSSKTTGALVVNGGVGVGGKLYASEVWGAVWNDYAEFRHSEKVEPGRVVVEDASGQMKVSSERLQPGANVVSDTFGFAIGETEESKTPIAVAGRVLVYTYEDRNTYPLGAAVCAAPNGTVSLMTREEIREYPERIIGTVSEIPQYEVWGTGNIQVNNRIWIKIR